MGFGKELRVGKTGLSPGQARHTGLHIEPGERRKVSGKGPEASTIK